MAFELVSDELRRPVARFKCDSCSAIADVQLRNGQNLNPTLAAQALVRRGWSADAYCRQPVRCSACIEAKRSAHNDVNSELVKVARKVANMNAQPIAIRDATTEQRGKMRQLLDKYFDCDDGCYLDGWSDQKIAEQVGVPRLIVERSREASYGPILVTLALLETRKELAAIRDDLRAANDLLSSYSADIAKLQARVAAVEPQLRKAG